MFVLSLMYPGFSVLTDVLLVILERLHLLSGVGSLTSGPVSLTPMQIENGLLIPRRQSEFFLF